MKLRRKGVFSVILILPISVGVCGCGLIGVKSHQDQAAIENKFTASADRPPGADENSLVNADDVTITIGEVETGDEIPLNVVISNPKDTSVGSGEYGVVGTVNVVIAPKAQTTLPLEAVIAENSESHILGHDNFMFSQVSFIDAHQKLKVRLGKVDLKRILADFNDPASSPGTRDLQIYALVIRVFLIDRNGQSTSKDRKELDLRTVG